MVILTVTEDANVDKGRSHTVGLCHLKSHVKPHQVLQNIHLHGNEGSFVVMEVRGQQNGYFCWARALKRIT